MTTLSLHLHQGDDVDVVVARGELDLATHQELPQLLEDGVATRPVLVVDLSEVTFLDSLGIAALVKITRATKARDAQVVLVASTAPVTKLLRMSGLDTLLDVHASMADFRAATGRA